MDLICYFIAVIMLLYGNLILALVFFFLGLSLTGK